MMMIKTLIVSVTFLFSMCMHPMSMGLTLIANTVMVALMSGMLSFNFWYSFILFMMIITGMMVLFIYMTSITSNLKFEMPYKLMMPSSMALVILLMFYFKYPEMMINLKNENILDKLTFSLSLNKYLAQKSMYMLIMLMIYLLLTLIAVVKITNIESGPLRKS